MRTTSERITISDLSGLRRLLKYRLLPYTRVWLVRLSALCFLLSLVLFVVACRYWIKVQWHTLEFVNQRGAFSVEHRPRWASFPRPATLAMETGSEAQLVWMPAVWVEPERLKGPPWQIAIVMPLSGGCRRHRSYLARFLGCGENARERRPAVVASAGTTCAGLRPASVQSVALSSDRRPTKPA
jgi:hypothetical protein